MPFLGHTEDQRASPSRNHHLLRAAQVQHGQPEGAFDLGHGFSHRLAQVAVEIKPDQVREHLRVGFRSERDALGFEPFPQHMKVLDDAVVDHEHVLILIGVRVGVALGGLAVSRPSRVSDSRGPVEFHAGELLLQRADPSRRLEALYPGSVMCGEPRGIIPPIFKMLEPLHQDGARGFATHIADDTAHCILPSPLKTAGASCPFQGIGSRGGSRSPPHGSASVRPRMTCENR